MNLGPISVAIDASAKSFGAYIGGVYSDINCDTSLNHAVTIVGYNGKNNPPYYIVRNSWGSDWGN